MAKSGIPDLPDSPNQPASYSFLKIVWKENCSGTRPASNVLA